MKKGFTLVELLAVIVILAVIGLIALPITSSYIIKSKTASYKTSVQNLMEVVKEYVSKYEENNDFPEGGIDITKIELQLKKTNFQNGIIKRNENNEIEAINVYDGEYCANGTKQNMVVERVNSLEECSSVDASRPDLKVKVVNVSSTKINITAIAKDAQTGIKDYKYCIGDECSGYVKQSSYEFNNLKNGTEYEITVIVRNNNYGKGDQYTEEVTTNTKKIKVKTKSVTEPEFRISSSSYSTSKEITIIYPGIEGYKNSYQMIDEEGNILEESEVSYIETTIIINKNGTLKARATNGEEVIESELIIKGIDEEAPEVFIIMSETWERPKQIEIVVKDNGSGLATKPYSYNGGKSWVSNNKKSFQENATMSLIVRDKLNNQTTVYRICSDKDSEGNPINCGEVVDEIVIDKIDTVKPTCSLKVTSGDVGVENWYRSNVEIDFDIIDDKAIDPKDSDKLIEGSGVVESYIDKPRLTEEGKYVITGTVKDKVGNEGTCSIEVNIDKTKPVCGTMTVKGTSGVEGWYRSDVEISKTNGTDSLSGHYTTTLNYTNLTNETNGTVVRLTTTDKAGNVCTSDRIIKIDKTKPTCGTYTISGTAGANGWYISDVGITKVNGTDSLSGHYTTKLNYSSINTETKGTNLVLTTTDKAGNICTIGETIKIDKTPPTIEYVISGNKVNQGYQSGLQVTVKCNDTISTASGTKTQTLTTRGTHTINGVCKNEAGYEVTGSNSYLIYIYTADSSLCGTKQVDCNPYACGWSNCATGSPSVCVGGYVIDYNNCTNYSCYLYKSCETSGCGCSKYGECEIEYTAPGACRNQCSGICGGTTCTYQCCKQYNRCRNAACGSEYVTGSACNNASSRSCISYGTKWDNCASTTNTCQGGYTSTCYEKCTVAASCWHL